MYVHVRVPASVRLSICTVSPVNDHERLYDKAAEEGGGGKREGLEGCSKGHVCAKFRKAKRRYASSGTHTRRQRTGRLCRARVHTPYAHIIKNATLLRLRSPPTLNPVN